MYQLQSIQQSIQVARQESYSETTDIEGEGQTGRFFSQPVRSFSAPMILSGLDEHAFSANEQHGLANFNSIVASDDKNGFLNVKPSGADPRASLDSPPAEVGGQTAACGENTSAGLFPLIGWGIPLNCESSSDALKKLSGLAWLDKEPLGSGSFGKVYRCSDLSRKHLFAVKMINEHRICLLSREEGEACGLLIPTHPNIAATYALIIYDPQQKTYSIIRHLENIASDTKYQIKCVISEYIDGSDLYEEIHESAIARERTRNAIGIRTFNQLESGVFALADEVFNQCSSALRHLHSHGYIYEDCKPENMMVSEMDGRVVIKLVDFGSVSRLPERGSVLSCDGSLMYMAPETAKDMQRDNMQLDMKGHDLNADWWGLGATLITLVCGVDLAYLWSTCNMLDKPETPDSFLYPLYNLSFSLAEPDMKKAVLAKWSASSRDGAHRGMLEKLVKLTSFDPSVRAPEKHGEQ